MQDHELLNSFALDASQEAFAEIVRRYADTVYSAARRQMRQVQAAEDVTQAVFLILAQKAGKIDRQTPLSAWLLKTTYFACQDARRQMVRRQKHEKAAAELENEMTARQPDQQAQLDEIGGELDAVLATLSDRDRGAVTLRYLHGKSINETAGALGISPSAAAKRIGRAIGRLRKRLLRRGIIVPAAGLAVALEQIPRYTAPPALAQSLISASASHTAATAAGNIIAKGTLHMMNWIRFKAAAMSIIVAALAATAGLGTVAILRAQEAPPAQPGANPRDTQPMPNFNPAAAQPHAQPVSFVTALKNGVSIELVGINESPSAGKQWWKPDGSNLEQPPYAKLGIGASFGANLDLAGGYIVRELAVRVNTTVNGSREPAAVQWSVVNARNTVASSTEQPNYKDLEARAVVLRDDPAGLTLRATIAADEWTTRCASGGNNPTATGIPVMAGLSQIPVLFGQSVQSRGKTLIDVTWTGLGNVSFRIVAVDSSGHEHVCDGLGGLGGETTFMGHFSTDLAPGAIKEWRLQTRPMDQWIEIRHVALHPGQQTQVEIVTSDDAAKR